jgi:hypothetical protein
MKGAQTEIEAMVARANSADTSGAMVTSPTP